MAPLVQRTSPAYDESMFRWLLILLFVGQAGLPRMGTCRGEDMQASQTDSCRLASVERVPSCCRTHVSGQGDPQANQGPSSKSDCGEHRRCCGCCVTSVVYCLLPETMFRSESVCCDRVELGGQSLHGIVGDLLTPPPKRNGVG